MRHSPPLPRPPKTLKDKGPFQHSLIPPQLPKDTVRMGQATPPMQVSSIPTPLRNDWDCFAAWPAGGCWTVFSGQKASFD